MLPGMTMRSHLLASGRGWEVRDFRCCAGPHDPAFEERHGAVCIAAVTEGTFQYRSSHGSTVLAPGAVLLGNSGFCFECRHEHAAGDRCLAFHFDPALWESVVAETPGVRLTAFDIPRLPPLPALAPLLAAAEGARDLGDAAGLEEMALRIAGAVATLQAGRKPALRPPSRDETRRVSDAVRRIEARANEAHPLAALADDAGLSRYHFLRVFRHVLGMTPHQFVLRTRMHHAAVRLRGSRDTISAVAFDAGFNDLSTFNRRFRRIMGVSPRQWRGRAA